ncbi:MAG: hypothetical protein LC793_23495, partial [Thermomicrobia bacterium]|nr:hypothetical protein [Thermomicrobia bacterium]
MHSVAATSADPADTPRAQDDRFPAYRPEGMDLAHTRFLTLPEHLLPFPLDNGSALQEMTIAYETWGTLAP